MQNGHKASNLCNYVGVPCDRGKLRLSSYFRVFYFRSLTPLLLTRQKSDIENGLNIYVWKMIQQSLLALDKLSWMKLLGVCMANAQKKILSQTCHIQIKKKITNFHSEHKSKFCC